MTKNKAGGWIAGTAFLSILVLVAAWFLLVSPTLATAAETRASADSQLEQNGIEKIKLAAVVRLQSIGSDENEAAADRLRASELQLKVANDSKLSAHAGREVIFGLRPEAITDMNGADRNSAQVVNADCHVEVVEPAGADTYVVTRLGGREVIGRMRSDMQVAPHSTVPFAFNMDKAVYFDPQSELRIA